MSDQVLSPDQLAAVDLEAGWPQSDIAQAVAIELNQSGGRTSEVGWNYQGQTAYDTTGTVAPPSGVAWDSYDVGEFQVDSVHSPGGTDVVQPGWMATMENPIDNAKEALALHQSDGWQPWAGDPSLSASHTNLDKGAQAAADVAGATKAQLDSWVPHFPGGDWNPLNIPSGFADVASSDVTSAASSPIKTIVFTGLAALAGLGLVVLGIHSASAPSEGPSTSQRAAKLAVMA